MTPKPHRTAALSCTLIVVNTVTSDVLTDARLTPRFRQAFVAKFAEVARLSRQVGLMPSTLPSRTPSVLG
eukprot:6183995-Pleurochrysis_carterae.AAC.1